MKIINDAVESLDDWSFHQCAILGNRIDGIKKTALILGLLTSRQAKNIYLTKKSKTNEYLYINNDDTF